MAKVKWTVSYERLSGDVVIERDDQADPTVWLTWAEARNLGLALTALTDPEREASAWSFVS